MAFGDHLEELRRRMIWALVGVGVMTGIGLIFGRPIVAWLCIPLAQSLKAADLPPQTIATAPTTGFAIYMKVALVGGLVLSAPWVLYQGWKFIELGLYQSERRLMFILAPFSAAMTLLGVLFMYYIMLPVSLMFLIFFSTGYPAVGGEEPGFLFRLLAPNQQTQPADPTDVPPTNDPPLNVPILRTDPPEPADGDIWVKEPEGELRLRVNDRTRSIPLTTATLMTPLIEIRQYINFVAMMTLGITIGFQLPLVMLILGWSRLVDPAWLARYRGYCVFACFALGMLLTPADVLSMVMLAVPLWGLFEFGLILMRYTYRRHETGPQVNTDEHG